MRRNSTDCVPVELVDLAGWLLAGVLLALAAAPAVRAAENPAPITRALLQVLGADPEAVEGALEQVDAHWDPRAVPMIMDTLYLSRAPLVSLRLLRMLEARTGQSPGHDVGAWWRWLWNTDTPMHPDYPAFKSSAYSLVDPRFAGYFGPGRPMTVRLDEVVWGGVVQDGIPPLRSPKMIPAQEATWLADDHVVFALALNGDARAYPKRILAWHEMFTDTVGGVAVTGVYCTLCGSMILYESVHRGVLHELGTSGFLYRSNKLMYDRATQSLWTTLGGEPVIGPLAGTGIRLTRGSVVTTTWGAWRRRHPGTTVLSLDTGHRRDYSEGAAYREYFATDELMFQVPRRDTRLANKAEVVALVLPSHPDRPLAVSARFLAANPIHHERIGATALVIVTDASGANRVYASGARRFAGYDGDRTLTGEDGRTWTLSEDALVSGSESLPRLPAHRAFWFGWHAAYPHTRLVR